MKNGSCIRLLFVFIPLLCLFCLGLFLDTSSTISHRERLSLSPKPDSLLFNDKQTEAYLADHILFRNYFLDFYFKMGMGLDLNILCALIGQEKWIFYNFF